MPKLTYCPFVYYLEC